LINTLIRACGITGIAVLASILVSARADAAPLRLQDCRLESTVVRSSVKARCGWFEVNEDRNDSKSKRIRIHVAVVAASRKEALRDPLVVISGGPGQAASDFYLSSAGAFERLRADRDIVVIDQRGTGKSNRLDCKLPDETETARFDAELIKKFSRECLQHLPGDPRFYSTSVAVQDLDEIREALGYGQINLYGISYGTRVAQHYLRRYPAHVRSVVLDGVVPVEAALGPEIAPAAQAALDSILERCASQTDCRQAFPNVKEELAQLRAQLTRTTIDLSVPDPRTALATRLDFGYMHMAVALRLYSYSDDTASLLPFLIHEAAQNRVGPMAAQALSISRSLDEQIANGMHNAVVCTEDIPFITAAARSDPAIERSYLRSVFVETLDAMCSVWPRGVIDENFHAPLQSETPVLLLSGENDPVTPSAYGTQAAKHFARGRHLIFPGQGHGQLMTACGVSVVRRFIEAGSADKLATECLTNVQPAPFVVDANGPTP